MQRIIKKLSGGGGGVLTSPLQAIKMMLTQIDITVLKIDLDQNSIKTTL